MADEEQSAIGRFLSRISSPFRSRTTPEPQMPLYTTGIQEPVLAQGITIPALYAVSTENLILRTVMSKLGQEIFRRGYYWEKKFNLNSSISVWIAVRNMPTRYRMGVISVVVKLRLQM